MKNRPKVVIVGVVRNCEKTFVRQFNKLISACRSFEVIDCHFVESDSQDNSVGVLEAVSRKYSNFSFETLGELRNQYENRIQRIRFCRNQYINYIRAYHSINTFDFVIVADMDGINSRLSKFSLDSCLKSENWDALFSNQLFGISDLLALRADNWIDEDFTVTLQKSREKLRNTINSTNLVSRIITYLSYDITRKKCIYEKMRIIPFWSEFISVYSAFGGIGIYRNWCVFAANYETSENDYECEHVSFHNKLLNQNAKMFINPRFINSFFNTYNINKFFIIRNLRLLRWEYLEKRNK